jgi:DNA-binding NarL/FixJ family response regulator
MLTIRIILVDDSPEFLESAAHFLSIQPSIQIVGRALSGTEALEQAARLQPDLVLVDWAMPEMNGLEAARCLKAQPAAPRVIVLTLYDTPRYRAAAQAAGTDGFVNKADFGAQLMPLIHKLFAQPEAVG